MSWNTKEEIETTFMVQQCRRTLLLQDIQALCISVCILISDFSWSDSKSVSSAKVQLSHSLTKDHAMKAHDALEVDLHIFLTSSLDEGERSVPRPQLLYPRGQIPQFALDRRLVGPRNRYTLSEEGPSTVENRTVNPRTSSPQPSQSPYR
jgi:hypothetical protein